MKTLDHIIGFTINLFVSSKAAAGIVALNKHTCDSLGIYWNISYIFYNDFINPLFWF